MCRCLSRYAILICLLLIPFCPAHAYLSFPVFAPTSISFSLPIVRTQPQYHRKTRPRASLTNGYSLQLPDATSTDLSIFRNDRPVGQIALCKEMQGWLHKADLWNNPDEANQMLYMEMQGAHFMPILQDLIPLPGRILAILNWQDQAGSGTPVKAQHLIEIVLNPHPSVRLLRELTLGEEVRYALPPSRLFAVKIPAGKPAHNTETRLLLFTGAGYQNGKHNKNGTLQFIAPDGKILKTLDTLPASLQPVSLQPPQRLQLKDKGYNVEQPFWSYDLTTRQLRHMPQKVAIIHEPPVLPMSPMQRLRDAARKNDLPTVQRLLAKGLRPDVDTLIASCYRGDDTLPILNLLIANHAPINAIGTSGDTPLFALLPYAVSIPDQDTLLKKMTFLLEHGANLQQTLRDETLLERAVQLRLPDVARFLLTHGADATHQGRDKITRLHIAALIDDASQIDSLIQAGEKVDAVDFQGKTPLFMTIPGNAVQAAQALLKAGANPNAFWLDIDFRHTLLNTALANNAIDIALLLIKQGADVRAPGEYGHSLLAMAMEKPYLTYTGEHKTREIFQIRKNMLIETLIEKGADINALDSQNQTPLSVAMGHYQFEKGYNWVKELLNRGADPNVRFQEGGNILSRAVDARRKDLEIPMLLLQHGADVNMGYPNATPLLNAVCGQDFSYARLLIEHGARTECHDNVHKTPLLWAAYYGQVNLIKLLVAHGANLQVRDDLGQDALALASKGNHPDAIAYLQSQTSAK